MTSRQALSKLKNDKKYSDEVINAIEKDLEILEILKDKLSVYIKADYCLSVMGSLDYQQLTKEEYKLLKEWLGR